MGSLYSTYISVRVCFIHIISVQYGVAAIYFDSTVDKDIDDCFLLSHDTKHSPKYNVSPLVLHRSLMQPAQYASM
jgi:hypothetical protein